MRILSRNILWLAVGLLALPAVTGLAQSPPGGFLPPQLQDLGFGLGGPGAKDPVKIEAYIAAQPGSSRGLLVVTATIEPRFHIYSLTQPPGGPLPTTIKLKPNDLVRLTGEIEATTPPKTHVDDGPWKGLTIEKHYGRAEWVAPIEIAAGADLADLAVEGTVDLQACDPNTCIPFFLKFTARHKADVPPPPQEEASGRLTGPTSRGSFARQGSQGRLSGYLEPAVVEPGGEARVVLTITPGPRWHAYALADVEPKKGNKATLIVVESASGLRAGIALTDATVIEKEPDEALKKLDWPTTRYHEGPVTWTLPIQVPPTAPAGQRSITGIIGFQICQESGQCETPQAARFQATLQVDPNGEPGGRQPLTFAAAEYPDAAKAAARRAGAEAAVREAPSPRSTSLSPAAVSTASDYDITRIEFREIEQRSIGYYLAIAFLGGIILNLMPCVLPVIGLKIMSFVQQAGHSRRQAFALNVWYSAGILAIFLLMAGLAAGAGMNMGDQFSSLGFNVFMCGLIFAMALSLLGVWEIPIPGFVGGSGTSKLMDREGPTGAFLKGVFTTILATPCLGPLMAPALGWAVQQPPGTTMLVFAVLGFGMALPYLVVGAFPRLIRFIPKPGAWMVTFKQIMGFVLLGTVIFFLSFMPPDSIVPTVMMLAGIGLACWWFSRIPVTAELDKKLSGWMVSAGLAAAVTWIAFGWLYKGVMQPRFEERTRTIADRRVGAELDEILARLAVANDESDYAELYASLEEKRESLDSGAYQPFSLAKLGRLAVEEGKTVLVDFTADWCLNCKVFEANVLHSANVEQAIDRQNVVTMRADYTHRPEHLSQVLRALRSNGVPVIAIFPGDDPYRPFVFRGAYTRDGILAALAQVQAAPARSTLAERKGATSVATTSAGVP